MKQNSHQEIKQIIRVDHAGEMGAKVIYEGQMLALKLKGDNKTLQIVEKMYQQELDHLKFFDEKIREHKIRPTLMQPFWKVGGFALGFITAIIDKKSAMTCTTAVEETIDEHYQEQLTQLAKIKEIIKLDEDQANKVMVDELSKKINQFREEELVHRDIGYEHNAKNFAMYKPFDCFIKLTTKFAIAISKKI